MSSTLYVDQQGNKLLTVHLWDFDEVDCAMCGQQTNHRFSVLWYCGPVLQGASEGGYKCVCEPCYKRWEQWSSTAVYYGA